MEHLILIRSLSKLTMPPSAMGNRDMISNIKDVVAQSLGEYQN